MAEALGIAGGIIAIIQLTQKLIPLSSYFSGVNRARDDLRKLTDELNALSQILNDLQRHINTGNSGPVIFHRLNSKDGPLQECISELLRLQVELEPKGGIRGIIKKLKWPLKEAEVLQYVSRIERHKGFFSLVLTMDNVSLSHHMNSTIQGLGKENGAYRATKKRTEILEWIYPNAFYKKHVEISEKREKNTGTWLLRTPEFQQLVNSRQLLWGYGTPGAGKTFLSSIVIDHLQKEAKYGLAYIYFDYMEQDQQRCIHVLASLVKQLAAQIPELPQEIENLYDKLSHIRGRPRKEDLYKAIQILSTYKSFFSRVFFVFDALDECDQDNLRKELLPLFHRMGKDGASIFLTSRQHPEDIQKSFRKIPKVELTAQDIDIRIYIKARIDENARVKRLVQQGKCEKRIISELIGCARGMFLLVQFHLDYIFRHTSCARKLLNALDNLKNISASGEAPLGPVYDKMMERVGNQPKEFSELGVNILSWLVKARRPLTVSEIQEAVSVEPGRYELDKLDIPDRATLVDVCAGLVTIDKNNTIRLAHYTVQEYLLKKNAIPDDASFKLAIACTTYLSFNDFSKGACSSHPSLVARYTKHPFLEYAAGFLSSHLKSCDEASTVDPVLRFLGKPGGISSYLQAAYVLRHRGGTHRYNWATYPKGTLPLHLASSLGHCTAISLLLEGSTSGSHVVVFKGLFSEKAGISAQDGEGKTALHLAASGGHDAAVRLLLAKGADLCVGDCLKDTQPSIALSRGWTVLHEAASKGHESTVGLLLEKGADVSSQDRRGFSALVEAVSNGHDAVSRLLLKNGASHSIPIDIYGKTLLHQAVFRGHKAVVEILLENGANASVTDERGRTPLHDAVYRNQGAIAQLLLKKGVNASAPDKIGRTPLHEAVKQNHVVIVKLLLKSGANASIPDQHGRTPLHEGTVHGRENIVRLLLLEKSNTSVYDEQGRTPLHEAVRQGREEIVQLLLQWGASPVVQDNRMRTPLHEAVCREQESIVRLLLQYGADVLARDIDGYTVLNDARLLKDQGMVLLLEGLDVWERDGRGIIKLGEVNTKRNTPFPEQVVDTHQWKPLRENLDNPTVVVAGKRGGRQKQIERWK